MHTNINRVEATIATDPTRKLFGGVYRPSYGTGDYLKIDIADGDGEHCITDDGECAFEVVGMLDETKPIAVTVIKGDVERIKALVKAEIDHFDCELHWVD